MKILEVRQDRNKVITVFRGIIKKQKLWHLYCMAAFLLIIFNGYYDLDMIECLSVTTYGGL
jgi:hypothetical protein